MPAQHNMTIKRKLTAIIMLTCIVALLAAGVIFIAYNFVQFRRNMATNLLVQAEMMADNCKAALAFDDPKDAEETLIALRVEPSIVYACVRTSDGKIFATYQRDKADEIFGSSQINKKDIRFTDGFLTVSKNIILDEETIGSVSVTSDLSPMYAMLKRNISTITAIVLLVALSAYLIASRLQAVISRPVLSLAGIAKKVSEEKNYSIRAQGESNDEIGLLIDSFNEMLEQIQMRDSELTKMNEILEEKVKQRTAHLSEEIEQRKQAEQQLRANEQQLMANEQQLRANEQQLRASNQQLEAHEQQLKTINQHLQIEIAEHKKTEQSLRKNREHLSEAEIIAEFGSWDWDLINNKLFWSDGLCKIFGVTAEEFGQKYTSFLEFVHPDDIERVKADVNKSIEQCCRFEHEHRIIRPDGRHRVIHAQAKIIADKNNKAVRMLGTAQDITDRKKAEAQLREIHKNLVTASHRAGMAEVATDVLHNVGNVLNSINVSVSLLKEQISNSKVLNLKKVADMIQQHTEDVGSFLTEDEQGRHIPGYLIKIAPILTAEQDNVAKKLEGLDDNVQHIKEIIKMQQSFAKVSGLEVATTINEIVENAVQINSAGLKRHKVELQREFAELPEVYLDKQRVLQILVNLINNAKYALTSSEQKDKLLTIKFYKISEDRFKIEVADNGTGIPRENLTKIFRHGFTTKKHGHGFGLHSGALAAKEMGGSLSVHSDGQEKGTKFTLELPYKLVVAHSNI